MNIWRGNSATFAAVLMALAAPAALAQVLTSYTLCSASNPPVCSAQQAKPLLCRTSTPSAELQAKPFLQWAVAMHRTAESRAGVAMRTINPAAPDDTATREASARRTSCSW